MGFVLPLPALGKGGERLSKELGEKPTGTEAMRSRLHGRPGHLRGKRGLIDRLGFRETGERKGECIKNIDTHVFAVPGFPWPREARLQFRESASKRQGPFVFGFAVSGEAAHRDAPDLG